MNALGRRLWAPALLAALARGAAAGVAVRPVVTPVSLTGTLPGFAAPAPLLSPRLAPMVPILPAMTATLTAPVVAAPVAAPVPAVAATALPDDAPASRPATAPRVQLETLAGGTREPGRPAPAFAFRAAAFFDGARLPGAAVSAVDVPADPAEPARPGLAPAEERFPGELMGDQGARAVPGSIFGWKPFEEAPGHGFWPLDALARRLTGPSRRMSAGYALKGAPSREEARVHFYGEKHSDKALIAANMRALVDGLRPGKPANVLVEGYIGPTLRGELALRFLAHRGLDADGLLARGADPADLTVRGWDNAISHDASSRPVIRHHMALLELNQLMHSDRRGLGYYRALARQAWTVFQLWREMRAAVIGDRNRDLDAAVAEAAREAAASGGTVHVIAGAEHLLERPLWAGVPVLGRAHLRSGLEAALGGLPYWGGKPPDGGQAG